MFLSALPQASILLTLTGLWKNKPLEKQSEECALGVTRDREMTRLCMRTCSSSGRGAQALLSSSCKAYSQRCESARLSPINSRTPKSSSTLILVVSAYTWFPLEFKFCRITTGHLSVLHVSFPHEIWELPGLPERIPIRGRTSQISSSVARWAFTNITPRMRIRMPALGTRSFPVFHNM